MHALHAFPFDRPAAPAPIALSTDALAPWRAAPHVQGAAASGTPDRAAAQWVWHSRFGPVFLAVRGQDVFVHGDRVVPHAP